MSLKKFACAFGFSAPFILAVSPVVAGPLQIQTAAQRGSGYGFRIGNQCVVLTAAHVVTDNGALQNAIISDDRVKHTTVAEEWSFSANDDIARYSTAASNIPSCVEPFIDPAWSEGFDYRANSQALLVARTSPSQTVQLPVRVTSAGTGQFIFFTEVRKGNVVTGYSGSLLFLNDKPLAIATELKRESGQVIATPLLSAVRLWPAAFRTDGFRTPIILASIMSGRREKADWMPLAIKALQDKPNLSLVFGQEVQNACRINITVTDISRSIRENPTYTNYRNNCSGSKRNIFSAFICPAEAPVRSLYDYTIQYLVQAQRPDGPPRVSTPSFTYTLPSGSFSNALVEGQIFEASIARAIDHSMQNGGCR